jgi:hypothetical protein
MVTNVVDNDLGDELLVAQLEIALVGELKETDLGRPADLDIRRARKHGDSDTEWLKEGLHTAPSVPRVLAAVGTSIAIAFLSGETNYVAATYIYLEVSSRLDLRW